MKYFYIVWIIFFWKLVHSCELKVKIADGVLKGKTLKSRDGRNFYSYTAIPFAKPPIGELRFKVTIILNYSRLVHHYTTYIVHTY